MLRAWLSRRGGGEEEGGGGGGEDETGGDETGVARGEGDAEAEVASGGAGFLELLSSSLRGGRAADATGTAELRPRDAAVGRARLLGLLSRRLVFFFEV